MKTSLARRIGFLIAGLISLSPLFYFLFKLPLSPRRDWDYFNSLSLLIGDSLSQGMIPLLDPWVCGGIDMLANPQNWVYSPFSLFSVIFSPYLSNVLSLLVCAAFGYVGMYQLTEENENTLERILLAALFCLSPFFFLHFAEGHIPYRTFYFLPWILYFSRNTNLTNLWLTHLCLAFMFLDGGLYPFYFSIFLILLNLNWKKYWEVLSSPNGRSSLILMMMGFVMLIFAKALPVLLIHEKRIPEHETATYSLANIFRTLYNYQQSNFFSLEGQKYAFHEYGHYLGMALTILLLVSLKNLKKNLRIVLQILLFAWIAFGIGGDINPWLLIKKIPLVNHLHVQSRFLIMLYLMILLLINKWEGWKKAKLILLGVAMIELLGVGFYITSHSFQESLDSRNIKMSKDHLHQERFVPYISKPEIYTKSGTLSYQCYEPANPKHLLKRHELFSETGISAVINDNTITIRDDQQRTKALLMNYNWNGGWDCEGCEALRNHGLIEIHPNGQNKEYKLHYAPVHYQVSITLLLLGLSLFLYTFFKLRKLSTET